jgi:hypothetical protein
LVIFSGKGCAFLYLLIHKIRLYLLVKDEIRKHKWIEGEKGRKLFWKQAVLVDHARSGKPPRPSKPSMAEYGNCNIILNAPLFIGVSVGVTALGNGVQEGGT